MDRVILHCDMNNFYASVECMLDPTLVDLPIAVCGSESERHGIVLAKNERAKASGVRTAEPIWQAMRKCPGLKVVSPHFDEYVRISRAVRRIYERYTDLVESFGLDECWLDCSSSARLFGSGEEIARELCRAVKEELGLTISVGVSFNKVFAKLASDMKKPNAVSVISKENFRDVAWRLPAKDMLGVGAATGARLKTIGISTIGDLAVFPEAPLYRLLGSVGRDLRRFALGLDFSPVEAREDESPDHSIGHGITTAQDLTTPSEVETLILSLTEEIGHRLFLYHRHADGIAVSVRDSRLRVKEWQCKLSSPTQSARTIAKEACELFRKNYGWENPLRSVSVRAIGLSSSELSGQIGIFDDETDVKSKTLDRTVEEIRRRFGLASIRSASLFGGMGKRRLPSRRERCAFSSAARL